MNARLPASVLRVALAALAAVAGAGCDANLADCADAACRLQRAEAAFADAPIATLRQVSTLADPIEQAALIELLVHRFPEHGATICAAAPRQSPAAERCARLTLRPHLFASERLAPIAPVAPTVGPGPRADLPPPVGAAAPWTGLPIDAPTLRGPCGSGSTCLEDLALQSADAGDAVGAGQRCMLAWPEGSVVRDECTFQIAERLMIHRGSAQLETALAVCAQTGALASNCVQHIILFAVPPPMPADAPNAAAVQAVTALAARVQAAGGPGAGEAYADLVWSVWLRDAVLRSHTQSGALRAWIPAAALPHLRMALAWRAALRLPPGPVDPIAMAQALHSTLEGSGAAPGPPQATHNAAPQPGRAFWRWDRRAEDASLPAVYALGAGRRTIGQTPEEDALIAVLEALARLPSPPPAATFSALLGTTVGPRARWTAGRLAVPFTEAELVARAQGGGVAPGAYEALMRLDTDPLVIAGIEAEIGATR